MDSDWLAAMLSASQMLGLKIWLTNIDLNMDIDFNMDIS